MSFTYSLIGIALSLAKILQGNGPFESTLAGFPDEDKIWNILSAIGDIAFAYSFSTNLINIQDTVKWSAQEKKVMKNAISIAITTTSKLYLLFALTGYAAFGNAVPGNFMDSSVTIYIHHHGDFEHKPKPKYVGGVVEVIPGFDSDLFSFRDLDDFAVKCGYAKSDLVYFKNDGLTFESGMRLLYDDSTVRAMVDIHKPIGKINLYIDHYDVDEVIDNQGDENENQAGENEYGYEGDDVETESDESEDEKGYDSFCDSDEELREFREKKIKYKDSLKQNNGNLLEVREKVMSLSDDSEYASDELRSDSSSVKMKITKLAILALPTPRSRKEKEIV
ncbi:hypothetical protein AgCh_000758 [Apium graveolens]